MEGGPRGPRKGRHTYRRKEQTQSHREDSVRKGLVSLPTLRDREWEPRHGT